MLTRDTRMTTEVHNCFHEQQRNWSMLLKVRTVVAATTVCVATYSFISSFKEQIECAAVTEQPDYKCD